MDIYQKRYLNHQRRKFVFLRDARRSRRVYTDEHLTKSELGYILEAVEKAPSSCDRKAVSVAVYRKPKDKQEIEQYLVGGRTWVDKADTILLLFADMLAYKSPNEVDYQSYLDAGVIVGQAYLAAEAINVGMCFVNPNVLPGFEKFNKKNLRFCGAIVLGKYDVEPIMEAK